MPRRLNFSMSLDSSWLHGDGDRLTRISVYHVCIERSIATIIIAINYISMCWLLLVVLNKTTSSYITVNLFKTNIPVFFNPNGFLIWYTGWLMGVPCIWLVHNPHEINTGSCWVHVKYFKPRMSISSLVSNRFLFMFIHFPYSPKIK